MSKQKCECGCDNFRFYREPDTMIFTSICRNCGHTLSHHRRLPSLEQ